MIALLIRCFNLAGSTPLVLGHPFGPELATSDQGLYYVPLRGAPIRNGTFYCTRQVLNCQIHHHIGTNCLPSLPVNIVIVTWFSRRLPPEVVVLRSLRRELIFYNRVKGPYAGLLLRP